MAHEEWKNDPNDPRTIAYNESKRGRQSAPMPGFVRDFFSGWRWWGDGKPDSTQTDAQRIASSRDGWNVGANSQQRMTDFMRAAGMPIGRQDARSLQPNDPRLGRIGGAFGASPVDPNQSGQFTPGYTPAPPPPTLDDLYAQLYEMQRGTAQGLSLIHI